LLSILISYWYHPPKRWEALQFDVQVNLAIMRQFDAKGIRLIPAASITRFGQEDAHPAAFAAAKDT
jgi:hypothetical protein